MDATEDGRVNHSNYFEKNNPQSDFCAEFFPVQTLLAGARIRVWTGAGRHSLTAIKRVKKTMRKFDRAIVIRRKILNHPDDNWEFVYQNGIMRLSINGNGWRALIWTSLLEPSNPADTVKERRLFLEKCRRQICPHTLDVWCDGQGKVLSFWSKGMAFRLMNFKRGEWEAFFCIRPPENRKADDLYLRAKRSAERM